MQSGAAADGCGQQLSLWMCVGQGVQAKEALRLNCSSKLAAMAQHLVLQWPCCVYFPGFMLAQVCGAQSALFKNNKPLSVKATSKALQAILSICAWRDHEALSTPAPPQLLTSRNLDLFSGRMRQEHRHWHRLEMYSSSSSSMGSSRAALQAVGSVLCYIGAAVEGLAVWHATHSWGASNVLYTFWVPMPHARRSWLS